MGFRQAGDAVLGLTVAVPVAAYLIKAWRSHRAINKRVTIKPFDTPELRELSAQEDADFERMTAKVRAIAPETRSFG